MFATSPTWQQNMGSLAQVPSPVTSPVTSQVPSPSLPDVPNWGPAVAVVESETGIRKEEGLRSSNSDSRSPGKCRYTF